VRSESDVARLARLGFADPRRAALHLDQLEASLAAPVAPDADPWSDDVASSPSVDLELVLADLAAAADPDLALLSLGRIADAGAPLHRVLADRAARRRLLAVVGVSAALADHLVAVPSDVNVVLDDDVALQRPTRDDIRESFLHAVGANPDASAPIATDATPARREALVRAYRRALVQLAARDLAHNWPVDDVAAELADLADGVLEAGLALARAERPQDAALTRLSVIAMGKAGGRELNYVSDVDVVFVAEPAQGVGMPPVDDTAAMAAANRLAAGLIRVLSDSGAGGAIWEVDAALRPEGKAGPLVRSVAGHTVYYERWAETWEFQALLKARPAAGDLEVGQAYADAVGPFVWTAARRPNFVEDVQRMRRRVEEHVPSDQRERELKLGRGGLRDVEFAVQLLQLVHGRSDVMLRSPTTLVALEALATWGYVGRDDASQLASAYRFLRRLEHRIQLQRLQRTHLLPDSDAELRRLGRSLGYRTDPAAELLEERRRHATVVRRIHEKLFYRPLLQAVARLEPGEARLTPEAARDRLVALGYVDPEGALRHIRALAAGVSRRAAIQRTLLPVLLGWFADAPEPDAALLAFRQVSDALGSTPWFLAALRDGSATAERLARLLSSSRYVTDLLLRAPEGVALVTDDAELRDLTEGGDDALLRAEVAAIVERNDDPIRAVEGLRALRRRELLRTASADVLGLTSLLDAQRSLTTISQVTLQGALQVALDSYERSTNQVLPTRMAIIAMGRFGGAEVGYGSDVDVMFVHDPKPDADGQVVDWLGEEVATRAAMTVANEVRTLLMAPSADPPLIVDADLRPEGRQGPLVRTLEAYAAYYRRWSSPWEAQALLRAVPVAGDVELGARFVELIAAVRYPVGGIGADELREMRRLKARMESERLPRGADPTLHIKLGRGGLSDVEWVAQLWQLKFAAAHPQMQTTSTVATLQAAADADLLTSSDAATLIEAWEFASRVRSAIVLARGRASESVPTDSAELAGVAHLLGYRAGERGQLLEDYRRTTRRARLVFERLFYGDGSGSVN